MGLAVHNYHDTFNALPPGAIARHRMTLFPLLYPFIEKTSLHDKILDGTDTLGGTGSNKMVNGDRWWNASCEKLTDEDRKGFGSVSIYICSSRGRSKTAYIEGNNHAGPQHDYAFVVTSGVDSNGDAYATESDSTYCAWWDWGSHDNTSDRAGMGPRSNGPFRVSVISFIGSDTNPNNNVIAHWEARDTIAHWRDGTSNQLLIGEKHFPRNSPMGTCTGESDQHDCSYLKGPNRWEYCTQAARQVDKPEAVIHTPGNDLAGENHNVFAAPHTGVCNFLIGDGSVRGVSATTSIILLRRLADVRDGTAVSLP
jgi:hypothetical protein